MRFVVVRAVAGDARRLADLCRASRAYRGRYAEAIAMVTVSPSYLADHLVFVARDRRANVLGFYALVRDPPELDMLFVADHVQGHGIGGVLVRHMLEQARQCGLDRVRVVSHPPAEGFYLRCGARRSGVVPAKPPVVTWERPELWFTVENSWLPGKACRMRRTWPWPTKLGIGWWGRAGARPEGRPGRLLHARHRALRRQLDRCGRLRPRYRSPCDRGRSSPCGPITASVAVLPPAAVPCRLVPDFRVYRRSHIDHTSVHLGHRKRS
jgi:GNAT superfamily N-acetyltransferase